MRRMWLALISAVSALAFTQIASAADLPRKAPAYMPPPPVYSWTGCYIGANVGGVWSRVHDDWAANANFAGPGFISASGSHEEDGSGVIAGGQIGCQWQTGQLVWGAEGDFNYTGLSTSRDLSTANFGAAQIYHSDFESHWLATFRGRLGWLATPQFLIYATGGLAVAQVNYNDSVFFAASGSTFTGSTDDSRAGWTVGGGVEYAFDPHWSAKAEYLYVSIEGPDHTLTNAAFPAAAIDASHDLHEHIARVGLNYKFW